MSCCVDKIASFFAIRFVQVVCSAVAKHATIRLYVDLEARLAVHFCSCLFGRRDISGIVAIITILIGPPLFMSIRVLSAYSTMLASAASNGFARELVVRASTRSSRRPLVLPRCSDVPWVLSLCYHLYPWQRPLCERSVRFTKLCGSEMSIVATEIGACLIQLKSQKYLDHFRGAMPLRGCSSA